MFKGKLVFAILLPLFNASIHSMKSNEALRGPEEKAFIPVTLKFAVFFEKKMNNFSRCILEVLPTCQTRDV